MHRPISSLVVGGFLVDIGVFEVLPQREVGNRVVAIASQNVTASSGYTVASANAGMHSRKPSGVTLILLIAAVLAQLLVRFLILGVFLRRRDFLGVNLALMRPEIPVHVLVIVASEELAVDLDWHLMNVGRSEEHTS